jgi:serine/threonine protein kinase
MYKNNYDSRLNDLLVEVKGGFVQTKRPDKYTISKFSIGSGSYARVFRGSNIRNGEIVAIKVITTKKNNNNLEEHQFSNHRLECEVMLVLRGHPNILAIQDVFCGKVWGSDHQCIVTKYCRRGDLFNFLREQKRVTEYRAFDIFEQIISGLFFMHRKHIIHRDIKLENILLNEDGTVVIADFGFACRYEKKKRPDGNCGSPHYASPEVISGEFYEGPEADLWGAFVILYTLVVGSMPFSDNNPRELFAKISRGEVAFPKPSPKLELSDSFKELISQGLTSDRTARIQPNKMQHDVWINRNMEIKQYVHGKYVSPFISQFEQSDDDDFDPEGFYNSKTNSSEDINDMLCQTACPAEDYSCLKQDATYEALNTDVSLCPIQGSVSKPENSNVGSRVPGIDIEKAKSFSQGNLSDRPPAVVGKKEGKKRDRKGKKKGGLTFIVAEFFKVCSFRGRTETITKGISTLGEGICRSHSKAVASTS